MASDVPTRGRGPLRVGSGLAVVDEGRNRADLAELMRSQQLLGAGRVDEAIALLGPLGATPTTTVRAHAATILAALVADDTPERALDLLGGIPEHGVVVDRGLMAMIRSEALRRLGRLPEAVAAARVAWLATPSTERALVLTAALVAVGSAADAVVVLEAACDAEPGQTALLGQLAGALALAGRGDDADAVIARLEDLNAVDDAEWHRQRAWAFACRGRLPEARAAVERAAALDAPGTRRWCGDAPILAERGVVLA